MCYHIKFGRSRLDTGNNVEASENTGALPLGVEVWLTVKKNIYQKPCHCPCLIVPNLAILYQNGVGWDPRNRESWGPKVSSGSLLTPLKHALLHMGYQAAFEHTSDQREKFGFSCPVFKGHSRSPELTRIYQVRLTSVNISLLLEALRCQHYRKMHLYLHICF